jgi:hypothetical protein
MVAEAEARSGVVEVFLDVHFEVVTHPLPPL